MLFIAFYTLNTRYEREAARLRASLERLGLPHRIEGVPDRGSWAANVHQTAGFLCRMRDEYPTFPLVYVDADAVVWRRPVLFDHLSASGECDIAVHYRRGRELLNGTLYLAPTDACRRVLNDYRRRCEAQPTFKDEQQFLRQAIEADADLRVRMLPASYCFIHDLMKDDLAGDEPVIEHLQASREPGGRDGVPSTLLPSRRARLEEIGG